MIGKILHRTLTKLYICTTSQKVLFHSERGPFVYLHGSRDIPAEQYFDGSPDRVLDDFLRYEFQPRDPAVLQEALQQEQRGREQAKPGNFKAHITALHDNRIETEVRRIVDETNLKVIQDIMGHADITTTMNIYAEATKEKKQQAMANLNGKIKIM